MRILFDHGTPRGLARSFQGHTVEEAKVLGWDTLSNGELLTDSLKVPATGPIGLEGDRGQMEYRRIRIKEMP